jgi:hypothetical protein
VGRARHLALGSDEPDESIARSLEGAAAIARARGTIGDAAELGELSTRATPPAGVEAAHRRGLRAGRDYLAAGDSARAREVAVSLVKAAPPGRRRAEAQLLLGEVEARAGSPPEAIRTLRAGLREAAGEHDLEAQLHQLLALVVRGAEGAGEAGRHASAAVELAERLGDAVLEACALAALAEVRFGRGEPGATDLLPAARSTLPRPLAIRSPSSTRRRLSGTASAGRVRSTRRARSCSRATASRSSATRARPRRLCGISRSRSGGPGAGTSPGSTQNGLALSASCTRTSARRGKSGSSRWPSWPPPAAT